MINAQQLTRRFGTFTAVDQLDLDIHEGEIFCFLGPNGAGKTTTIKMMCGLLHPSSGTIHIGGHDIQQDPTAVHRMCGYIPDQPYLYDRLTCIEFCLFCADLYQVPRAEALRRLDFYFDYLGLDTYRTSLVQDLSHGLRQRLLYAATFVHEPQVLFVDEPFVGLDPYSIRSIRQLLKQKARHGATIFMTTHILLMAEELADRIGIIHQGQLAACGTLDDLIAADINASLEDLFLSITT